MKREHKEIKNKILITLAGLIAVYFFNIFIKGIQAPINDIKKEIVILKEENNIFKKRENMFSEKITIIDKELSNLKITIESYNDNSQKQIQDAEDRRRENVSGLYKQIDFLKREILLIYKRKN